MYLFWIDDHFKVFNSQLESILKLLCVLLEDLALFAIPTTNPSKIVTVNIIPQRYAIHCQHTDLILTQSHNTSIERIILSTLILYLLPS